MIIAIDIETRGLDATKFVCGCLLKETSPKRPEFYRTKKALWKRVLELAEQENKRNKTLTIYSHNAQYDTAGYVNLKDKNLKFFCNKPFIWAYKRNGKEIIKFLDTMSIFKMNLKKIGQLISLPKLEMPNALTTGEAITSTKELKPYITRDCEIVLKSIEYLKNKLKEDGIKTKRLITINRS